MTTIRPSADLRNHYNEISKICREEGIPVFITKNGHGDSVLLSIEQYNQLVGRQELYRLIDDGLEDERSGNVLTFKDAMSELRERIAKR